MFLLVTDPKGHFRCQAAPYNTNEGNPEPVNDQSSKLHVNLLARQNHSGRDQRKLR
jgi:hypothetical protein